MNVSDFVAGFAHPASGADHILAMISIGLWGVIAGGRAMWAWPAAFVVMVVMGFVAAISGVHVPLVEPAIASSIVVLGLLVALAVRAPLELGVLIAGLFAFFHGHAHGTEAAVAHLWAYALGLAVTTVALHATGIALCRGAIDVRQLRMRVEQVRAFVLTGVVIDSSRLFGWPARFASFAVEHVDDIIPLPIHLRLGKEGKQVLVAAVPVDDDDFLAAVARHLVGGFLEQLQLKFHAVRDGAWLVLGFKNLAKIIFRKNDSEICLHSRQRHVPDIQKIGSQR